MPSKSDRNRNQDEHVRADYEVSEPVTPLQSSSGTRPKTNPDLFAEGSTTSVASPLPLLEASNILTQRKHLPWQTDPDGKLSYVKDLDRGEGAIHFWVTDRAEGEHPVGLASAAALAVIDTFDIRAACLHLIYAAYAAQVDNPWEHEIVIDDRQLEKYLGLQKRTDLNRQQKLELMKNLAEQPCKITTFVTMKSTPKQKGFTVAEGRLWHLLETRYHYQHHLLGNPKELAGMTFVIKPGSWAKYFLGESARANDNLTPQYSRLSKALLESVMSIWQHREGAARLMIWLLFKSQGTQQYPYEVRTLMEVAYGTDRLHQALENRKIRARLANTWDEDLLFLNDQGWKLLFDDDTYPVAIRPLGFGRTDDNRPRGFFERILTATIWLSPPDEWLSLSLPKSSEEDTDSQAIEATTVGLTADEVKAKRKERGWSQRKLAKLSGISQSLISLIEKGDRQISADTDAALQRVFDFM